MESRKVLERDLQGSSQHLSRGVKWEVMYLHPELSEISALAIHFFSSHHTDGTKN